MDSKAIARHWATFENQRKEDTRRYLISIYNEQRAAQEDLTHEIGHTQIEIDRETVDTDTLQRYGREYGISQASSSHLIHGQNPLWFYSVIPREDRAYFEKGIETYFSLHLHAVDDRVPQMGDYQRVARLMDVRLQTGPMLARDDLGIAKQHNHINIPGHKDDHDHGYER